MPKRRAHPRTASMRCTTRCTERMCCGTPIAAVSPMTARQDFSQRHLGFVGRLARDRAAADVAAAARMHRPHGLDGHEVDFILAART